MRRRILLIVVVFASVMFASVIGWLWVSNLQSSNIDMAAAQPEREPEKPLINGRVFPFGEIDVDAVQRARLQVQQMRQRPVSGLTPAWIQRGPNNIQGRVTDIAVDPMDDDIAYIGAAEGGVFRTRDGGDSWVPVFDEMPSISIGALALHPTNPNILFAGTGESNPSADSYPGSGLYRSNDQGDTWTQIGLEDSGRIGRIVIHPTNPDIMHVAVGGYVWSAGVDRGVYRTEDGGASWTRVLFINDITGCSDIVQRSDNPDILFAAMWERIRSPGSRIVGGPGSGVHRSDDGGLTWSLVGSGLPPTSPDNGRIGLAISQSHPDVMCAVYATTAGPFGGLFRTTDGGANWARTNDSGISNLHNTFGWWFGNVRIHPQDENVIFAIGFVDYRSSDGGNSYSQIGGNMHVDHHAFAFGSGKIPKMYAGNDGGVYTSTDGVNFSKTTGDLPITQAYRVAQAAWNPDALWLGTQDNGTLQDLEGDGQFGRIYGGDGFQPLPHLTDVNRIWVQYQWGNVRYSNDGGNSFSSATNGLTGRRNWDAPHAFDPSDPETRYFGTHLLFRNSGNLSWAPISNDLTGGDHPGSGTFGTLTTIGVSPVDSQIIWVGSDDGFVHVTQNGGGEWADVSSGLPLRWMTSVHPHPVAANEALVTVSGFRWGEDMAHVYHTEDFGQTWIPADTGLPDMPVNDVLIDPENTNRYFAATDIGVFQSLDAGQSWSLFGRGLPGAAIVDFAYREETREIVAGTHGRSIFTITIPEVSPATLEVSPGLLVGGTVNELVSSDNLDVSIRRGNTIQSIVALEVQGVSHSEAPSEFAFIVEASVFSRGPVMQTTSLFNYDDDVFETVDIRPASRFSDQRIEVIPAGDVSRFIQPGTRFIEARIQFDGGMTRQQITANIDQAIWFITR